MVLSAFANLTACILRLLIAQSIFISYTEVLYLFLQESELAYIFTRWLFQVLYRLSSHTPKFRYAANVTQSRYGICSHAAGLSTFRKDKIISRIKTHSAISQRKAKPNACKLKKIMLQKKLNTNCTRNSSRLRDRASDAGAR